MLNLVVVVVVVVVGVAQTVHGEVFTAMADMEALLGAEKHVTSVIDQYIEYETQRLQKLKAFSKEYERKNARALQDGIGYIGNPVNAFLLIKRLTSDWNYVESLMKNNMAEDFLSNITSQRENFFVKFPDQEDLNGAAVALMRLQDTYRLSTADMAEGSIQGFQKTDDVSAHDCFELGRVAYIGGDYYHCLLWMNEAMDRLASESPPSVEEADIVEYLAFSLYQQGNVKRALAMTEQLLEMRPDHPRARGNIKYYLDEMSATGMKKGDEADLPPVSNQRPREGVVPERDTYEALCRGEIPLRDELKARLYCYLKTDRPFLKVAPIKVEIVHLDPMAVVFRGVISDEEIEKIKELATPKLARATVHNKQTGKLEFASYRISKSAWLKEDDDEVIARVNRRINEMTNLNMDTAEDLQIANYGLGGHYDPHFDFARVANYGIGGHYEPHFDMSTRGEKDPYIENTGNRIATNLCYMEAPEAGGATVFPELEASIFPSKYDCLFWYNLHRNGEGDMRTRHAACPVLAGQKWVANKWIHERGQEEYRPCHVLEDTDETFVGELN